MTDPNGTTSGDRTPAALTILIPVFNDWATLAVLLRALDEVAAANALDIEILAVDDGSTVPVSAQFESLPLANIQRVEVLHLKRNMGHQRAICIGLVECHLANQPRDVLVMDGDGEDAAADILKLLDLRRTTHGSQVIFAERAKRAEGPLYKFFYTCFRYLHIVLVGDKIRVGNFSLIPHPLLGRLVYVSEIWNHYAAAVIHSRLPYATVAIAKSKRLMGESKMSFPSLVLHGLSAISVYGDIVGVRLVIVLSVVWSGATVLFLLSTLPAGGTPALSTILLLLVVLFQMLVILFMTVLIILLSRSHTHFVPARDCPQYVLDRVEIGSSRKTADRRAAVSSNAGESTAIGPGFHE